MSMDIYAVSGNKVRFTNEGGHNSEQQEALKLLKIGEVYTVSRTVVHDWYTEVYLVETGPEVRFNSVQFDDSEEP